MSYLCKLKFTSKNANAICNAVGYDEEYDRCKSKVSVDGDAVVIEMDASDLTALRATFNEYVRLLRVCESVELALK